MGAKIRFLFETTKYFSIKLSTVLRGINYRSSATLFPVLSNPNRRDMPKIWNIAFLKQYGLFGFPDKPFLFSDGMSGFCDIMLQKWRGLSEKTKLSLQISKSLPQI